MQEERPRRDSDLENVVRLLESENKLHGFRYFVFKGTIKPEMKYLREVADRLMIVVANEVEKSPLQTVAKGAVMKFTVSKAVRK